MRKRKVVHELETVTYEKEGKIARIILNRPSKLNALNSNMRQEIIQCIEMMEFDDNVLVGIIKGNGRAFCAGGDLGGAYSRYGGGETSADGIKKRPSQRARLWVDRDNSQFVYRINHCWKPMICQAHGYCLGWGMYISNACDITIAANDCLFGHPEQRQAFGGMVGIMEILTIGYKKARELYLLGSKIDATEAERIGWVNRVVPADALEEEVEKKAASIALLPRDAIAIGKAATIMSLERLQACQDMSNVILHSMATNLRFEPDEYNFMKERGKKGTTTAIHLRDAVWGES